MPEALQRVGHCRLDGAAAVDQRAVEVEQGVMYFLHDLHL